MVLGKWLAGDARIFIFDEPTRGVDVGAKVEIYNLMNKLTAEGAGIIMISSELPELLGMSDRILVMRGGRITAEFDAAAATQEQYSLSRGIRRCPERADVGDEVADAERVSSELFSASCSCARCSGR